MYYYIILCIWYDIFLNITILIKTSFSVFNSLFREIKKNLLVRYVIKILCSVFFKDVSVWFQNDSCFSEFFLYMCNSCQWSVLVKINLPLCTRATKEKKYQNECLVHDKNTMNIKADKGYVHQKTALLV